MRILPPRRAACAAALLLALCACDQRGPDGLTAEEREKLNQYAADLDGADVIDASPDSLVANEVLEEDPSEQNGRPENKR